MMNAEEIWSAMVKGEVYDASHPYLLKKLKETRERIWEFNNLRPSQSSERRAILRELLGSFGENFKFN